MINMASIFSGFNYNETQNEIIIVIEAPGIAVNANLDVKNLDKSYLILMKQNEDMKKFDEWYDKCIVEPFFQKSSAVLLLYFNH